MSTDMRVGVRARVRSTRAGRIVWRVLITIAGTLVTVLGVILLPLPGPGWLVIFAGLGILSTEYAWAARLLRSVRNLARRWAGWIQRRSRSTRLVLALLGVAVIAIVAYLLFRYEHWPLPVDL